MRFKYRLIPVVALLISGIAILQANANMLPAVHFFNPESNIDNFASLKKSLDSYLSEHGAYQFKPFKKREAFEAHLSSADKPPAAYMLSSWYYQKIREKIPMEPALVGLLDGKATHRLVLSSSKEVNSLDELKGKTVASSVGKAFTLVLLEQMFGAEKVLQDINLIEVPKDIDALMAVGFGMASAALTTERSLEKLEVINPKQYLSLNRLGKSERMLLSIIAVTDQEEPLVEIFEQLSQSPEGKLRANMMGLDGFRRISETEMGKLR